MGPPFWMRDGFNAGETSVSSLTCYAFTLAQWSVSDACDFMAQGSASSGLFRRLGLYARPQWEGCFL